MKISKSEQKRIWTTVKCNCGHSSKEHYNGEGWCTECACTWYYPNDKYILKYRERLKERG